MHVKQKSSFNENKYNQCRVENIELYKTNQQVYRIT